MVIYELFENVSWVSIILFITGILLLVLELYEPGFGLFGSLGVILLVACIFVTAKTVLEGIILTALFFVIIITMLVIFFTMLSRNRLPKNLVLHEATSAEQGFSGTEDMQYLLGKNGVVVTVCRPAGNVDFDGVKLDVVSRGEYIEKGVLVEVIEIEGSRIVVKAKIQ